VARRMGQAEPHVVLGVGRGASEAEVKRAFRRRAMETHPDVGGGSLEAYHRVREAYEACLSGAGRRERPARPGRGFGARYEGDWRGFGARQEEEGARAWRRAQAREDAERAWRQEQARAWAREARDRGPGPGARSGARSGARWAGGYRAWGEWVRGLGRLRSTNAVEAGLQGAFLATVLALAAVGWTGSESLFRRANRGTSFQDMVQERDARAAANTAGIPAAAAAAAAAEADTDADADAAADADVRFARRRK